MSAASHTRNLAAPVILAAATNEPAYSVGSLYTPAQLTREARALVKGLGKFIDWHIEVSSRGATLVARFVRHFNPSRPLHLQAVESVTLVL